jgi:hypothetical protein
LTPQIGSKLGSDGCGRRTEPTLTCLASPPPPPPRCSLGCNRPLERAGAASHNARCDGTVARGPTCDGSPQRRATYSKSRPAMPCCPIPERAPTLYISQRAQRRAKCTAHSAAQSRAPGGGTRSVRGRRRSLAGVRQQRSAESGERGRGARTDWGDVSCAPQQRLCARDGERSRPPASRATASGQAPSSHNSRRRPPCRTAPCLCRIAQVCARDIVRRRCNAVKRPFLPQRDLTQPGTCRVSRGPSAVRSTSVPTDGRRGLESHCPPPARYLAPTTNEPAVLGHGVVQNDALGTSFLVETDRKSAAPVSSYFHRI